MDDNEARFDYSLTRNELIVPSSACSAIWQCIIQLPGLSIGCRRRALTYLLRNFTSNPWRGRHLDGLDHWVSRSHSPVAGVHSSLDRNGPMGVAETSTVSNLMGTL